MLECPKNVSTEIPFTLLEILKNCQICKKELVKNFVFKIKNFFKTCKTKLISELFFAIMCQINQIIRIFKNWEKKCHFMLYFELISVIVPNYPVNKK